MGRLFWKFFLIFWLAQFVTAAGVGMTIWLGHSANRSGPEPFDGGPRPPPELRGADKRPPRLAQPPLRHLPPPLVPILSGSLVSVVFAALLAWYFARPIRTLRAAFEFAANGKLETRVGASMGRRNDELSDLGKSFDHMAGRLQSLIGTQRRLLHDVSHELRSPLARLQAAADLMQQQPERAVEFVERIQRDTARMDTLVGELLALARLDAGMTGNLDEEVDVYEIIADIANDASFESDGKRREVRVDLNESIVLRGNHELLHRAIENVVRNAVRHSPDGGVVVISAEAIDGRVHVTVADTGPGVPEDDLDAIFEAFFRSGAAGSSTGYGLGLAITRRVAEAHGGKAAASNRLAGGLLVALEFQLDKR